MIQAEAIYSPSAFSTSRDSVSSQGSTDTDFKLLMAIRNLVLATGKNAIKNRNNSLF